MFDDAYDEYCLASGNEDLNLFKNILYSRCHHFISAQGGGTYQCAYFSGSLIAILHRIGPESRWPYSGFFQWLGTPAARLAIAMNEQELLLAMKLFEAPSIIDGVADVPLQHQHVLDILAPDRPALRQLPMAGDRKGVPPSIV